jgi:hypothetical protein
MATKSINLKTKKAILIDQSAFLASVNELRSSRGATKKSKAPTTIQKLLSNTKVLEVSTEDFGSIGFSIHYQDKEDVPCTRTFPNFGLDVVSNSTLTSVGDQVSIEVDLTLTAGKKKWQLEEVEECVEIFKGGEYHVSLEYRCDTTSEPAGYAVSVQVLNGISDKFGNTELPNTMFDCTWK